MIIWLFLKLENYNQIQIRTAYAVGFNWYLLERNGNFLFVLIIKRNCCLHLINAPTQKGKSTDDKMPYNTKILILGNLNEKL